MRGLLVVNYFLNPEKFTDLYVRLKASADALGIELVLSTNRAFMHAVGEPLPLESRPDFVLFWDKDVSLAREFEDEGIPVFNSSCAIAVCDNKELMHKKLSGLPMPKTIIAPFTFANIGYADTEFLTDIGNTLGYPIVVKECFGSFGQQVYLAKNKTSLCEIVEKVGGVPLLFQELIKESFGRDVRVNVVGGRVLASMLRSSTNGDFRSNITLGGTAVSYSPDDEERELAISACERLGLDFAGVDLLFGKDGPLICEVNSNAHFKSTLDFTGVNMADEILSYIRKRIVK